MGLLLVNTAIRLIGGKLAIYFACAAGVVLCGIIQFLFSRFLKSTWKQIIPATMIMFGMIAWIVIICSLYGGSFVISNPFSVALLTEMLGYVLFVDISMLFGCLFGWLIALARKTKRSQKS